MDEGQPPVSTGNQAPSWQFNPESEPAPQQAVPAPSSAPVSWSASEFVAHEKSPGWFLALAGVVALISGTTFLLTRDYISAGMAVIVGIVFAIFAARKPRTLTYQVDDMGVRVEGKTYDYQMFKSFAVHEEGALHFLSLIPMKRFMPALTIYFAPQDESKITGALSQYLPVEQAKEDLIDRLMRKIRF